MPLRQTAVFLSIKLPDSIVGMGVLFALCRQGWVKTSWLQQLTDADGESDAVSRAPCVWSSAYLDLIADDWFSILVSRLASTLRAYCWLQARFTAGYRTLSDERNPQAAQRSAFPHACRVRACDYRARTGNIFCNRTHPLSC